MEEGGLRVVVEGDLDERLDPLLGLQEALASLGHRQQRRERAGGGDHRLRVVGLRESDEDAQLLAVGRAEALDALVVGAQVAHHLECRALPQRARARGPPAASITILRNVSLASELSEASRVRAANSQGRKPPSI